MHLKSKISILFFFSKIEKWIRKIFIFIFSENFKKEIEIFSFLFCKKMKTEFWKMGCKILSNIQQEWQMKMN